MIALNEIKMGIQKARPIISWFFCSDYTGISENPLFLIKTKGAHGEFTVSTAPTSYIDLLPTFLEILGENKPQYGRSIFNIDENEQRDRYFYRDIHTSEVRHIVEYYSAGGNAWEHENWKESGIVYYGDADPALRKYKFGTELSFGEDATGNLYTVDGFTRINDSYTITTGKHAEMNFPFKKAPNRNI